VNRPSRGLWNALALAGGFGLSTALIMALAIYVGSRVDTHLGTSPLFALVGLFLGVGAGIWSFVRWVRDIGKE
jgi:ATP synthase protein I